MTTSIEAIDKFLQQAAQLLHQNCLKALSKLGDECVAKIRGRSGNESWFDHSGNLRSSIGYAVYDQGLVFIQSSFPVVLQGAKGVAQGKKMIAELAKEYSRVYALVVLAGMEYASNVEAIESKDVLETTRIWAQSVVENRLRTAIDDAIQKINSWKI